MKTSFLKESLLYSKIKSKKKDAFLEAYDLYVDDIYRFIFFKIGNKEEAEDLTSQVFLNIWNYIQNDNDLKEETLKAFFYKSARNTIIDHYRAQNKTAKVPLEDENGEELGILDDKQDVEKLSEIKSDYETVLKKIDELKDDYKEIIVLRFIDEMSISEISDILDKTKGNIRILIFRALKALKELLKNEPAINREKFE